MESTRDGDPRPILEKVILSKNNHVYKVLLYEKEIHLQKDRDGFITSETVSIDDIIGSRCVRRSLNNNCLCGLRSKSENEPKVVDDNSSEYGENEVGAYLYIYAFTSKNSNFKSGKNRGRITIVLRFRSYDKFDENLREAEKWRSSLVQIQRRRSLAEHPDVDGMYLNQSLNQENDVAVISNPETRQCKALGIRRSKMVTFFKEANALNSLLVTRQQLNVRQTTDSCHIDQRAGGTAMIGGNAILFEIINGIIERLDWRKKGDDRMLGMISLGSGNVFAQSIRYGCSETINKRPAQVSTLNTISGARIPDLPSFENESTVTPISGATYSLIAELWAEL